MLLGTPRAPLSGLINRLNRGDAPPLHEGISIDDADLYNTRGKFIQALTARARAKEQERERENSINARVPGARGSTSDARWTASGYGTSDRRRGEELVKEARRRNRKLPRTSATCTLPRFIGHSEENRLSCGHRCAGVCARSICHACPASEKGTPDHPGPIGGGLLPDPIRSDPLYACR